MADLEVLYNSECPICNREINHYKKISKNNESRKIEKEPTSIERKWPPTTLLVLAA